MHGGVGAVAAMGAVESEGAGHVLKEEAEVLAAGVGVAVDVDLVRAEDPRTGLGDDGNFLRVVDGGGELMGVFKLITRTVSRAGACDRQCNVYG